MRFLCLLMCVWAIGLTPVAADSKAPATPRRLLILGDSLSAAHNMAPELGWASLLKDTLSQRAERIEVVNASISGETSSGGLARIEQLLTEQQPDLLILELGANDALRGLALSQTRANLQQIIVKSQSSGARILLIGIEMPLNYGKRYRDGLRRMYAELAATHSTALVTNLVQALGTDVSQFQEDRLHPTAAAQPQLLKTVWTALQPLL